MATDAHVIPLSYIREKLANPSGHKQVSALISQPNCQALVRDMPTPELFQLIKEVGFHDANPLIAMASPEQIRGCLDMDVWERDRPLIDAMKPWLASLVDAGFETLHASWQALDAELTALLFARWLKIYDLSLGEDPEDGDDRPFTVTPDTFYAIKYPRDEDTAVLARRIVDDLYRADMVTARHTLRAAHSEPPAELEEMSYRWRASRMADIGYVDFYDALEVFRPVDVKTVVIGENSQDRVSPVDGADPEHARTAGGFTRSLAETTVRRSFLARCLDSIRDRKELSRIETAIVVLTNKVLSAERIALADTEQIQQTVDAAIATLALGLDIVAGQNVGRGAQALSTISLTRLHRVGYSATLPLARVAKALAPRASDAGDPGLSVLEALAKPRPLFAKQLDATGGSGTRPFESKLDVHKTAEQLTMLALRIAIAHALGAMLPSDAPQPRPPLDAYVRTALVRYISGGKFDCIPLQNAEIEAFREIAIAGDTLSHAAKTRAAEGLRRCVQDAKIQDQGYLSQSLVLQLLDQWLADLLDIFVNLEAPPDPRFVTGVLLATIQS